MGARSNCTDANDAGLENAMHVLTFLTYSISNTDSIYFAVILTYSGERFPRLNELDHVEC